MLPNQPRQHRAGHHVYRAPRDRKEAAGPAMAGGTGAGRGSGQRAIFARHQRQIRPS